MKPEGWLAKIRSLISQGYIIQDWTLQCVSFDTIQAPLLIDFDNWMNFEGLK